LLSHVFRQLRQRHFTAQTSVVEGEYDLLAASISNGCDYRCQWDNPRWQVISTKERIHQRRFAPAESSYNQEVEPVFG
jgi:hypothetical protein